MYVRATLEEYLEEPWRWHPEEDFEDYNIFINYYLLAEATSVLQCYKTYLKESKGRSEDQLNRVKSASATFINLSRGCDRSGNEIPTLDTWEDRAAVYRSNVLHDKLKQIKMKRQQILQAEYEDALALVVHYKQIYKEVYDQFMLLMESSKKTGNQINIKSQVNLLKDLVRVRRELVELERIPLGMTANIREDIYAEALTENSDVNINFKYDEKPTAKEKFGDEDEFDNMSPEKFEEMLKRLKE